jgi:hypothetical protein
MKLGLQYRKSAKRQWFQVTKEYYPLFFCNRKPEKYKHYLKKDVKIAG